MVCLDAAYGAQDQFLVIQDTRGEFMNIYGWVLYISLSVTLWILWALSFTFTSVLCEAVVRNRLRWGESRGHDEGQQGQGWYFQLSSTDNSYLCSLFQIQLWLSAAQLFNQELVTCRQMRRWNVSRHTSQKFVLSSKVVALCLFSVGGQQSH